jgi:hypothetical protein
VKDGRARIALPPAAPWEGTGLLLGEPDLKETIVEYFMVSLRKKC